MEWTKLLVRTTLVLTISVLAIQVYYIYQLQNDFAAARETISAAPSAATHETNQANDEAENPAPDVEAKAKQTDDEPGQAVFLHKAVPENISGNSTYVDHPFTNGNPDAVLSVTHSWNPGGGPGTYNDHPIGVWYDASVEKWAIYNEDMAAMPENACFNVAALKSPTQTK